MSQTIAILGSGAWGTALATLALTNGHTVRLWSRSGPLSLLEATAEAQVILSAVSMSGVRSVASQVRALSIPSDTILVSATKGLDPDGDGHAPVQTAAQIWQAVFPDHPVVVFSGPNLSDEIQRGLPAASVVASTNPAAAQTIQSLFFCPNFRVYTNPDPLGVELGGTLKNVIAIAVGCCDALQLGTNAKAALVTRGLTEMIRIGNHWGAKTETFYGLAGLGDLLATCNSSLSRNYQVGFGLGQGKSLAEVLATLKGTAEGINTGRVLFQVATQQGISMPISQLVHQLIEGQMTPQAAIAALMLRDGKPEYNLLA